MTKKHGSKSKTFKVIGVASQDKTVAQLFEEIQQVASDSKYSRDPIELESAFQTIMHLAADAILTGDVTGG